MGDSIQNSEYSFTSVGIETDRGIHFGKRMSRFEKKMDFSNVILSRER